MKCWDGLACEGVKMDRVISHESICNAVQRTFQALGHGVYHTLLKVAENIATKRLTRATEPTSM